MKVHLPLKELVGKTELTINEAQVKEILAWFVNLYQVNIKPENVSITHSQYSNTITVKIVGTGHFEPVEVQGIVESTKEEKDMPFVDISS